MTRCLSGIAPNQLSRPPLPPPPAKLSWTSPQQLWSCGQRGIIPVFHNNVSCYKCPVISPWAHKFAGLAGSTQADRFPEILLWWDTVLFRFKYFILFYSSSTVLFNLLCLLLWKMLGIIGNLSLLQMKYIWFVGENTAGTDMKMHQAIQIISGRAT